VEKLEKRINSYWDNLQGRENLEDTDEAGRITEIYLLLIQSDDVDWL